MKNKPFLKGRLSETVADAWKGKEEASYEDDGRPETGHVYCMIHTKKPAGFVCQTREEAIILLDSADYHMPGSWDDPSPEVAALMRAMPKIVKKIKEALSNS